MKLTVDLTQNFDDGDPIQRSGNVSTCVKILSTGCRFAMEVVYKCIDLKSVKSMIFGWVKLSH